MPVKYKRDGPQTPVRKPEKDLPPGYDFEEEKKPKKKKNPKQETTPNKGGKAEVALDPNQLAKIQMEDTVRTELAQLEKLSLEQ